MRSRTWNWLAVVAAILLLPAAAGAQADPPGRVARLNYLKGDVSFRPAALDDWAPATLNEPLTTGDHVWTDNASWAEMHVGSTAIRLAPRTAFAFLNLDDSYAQLRLAEGALDIRVRTLEDTAIEIDTPSAAISLIRPGVYRVDVLPDGGSTRVTVRYGLAEVLGDGPAFRVRDGEAAAVYGSGMDSYEVFRAGAADSWELWCRARDEREDNLASLRYVSSEMTGYEDLDDYGTWRSEPEYGWVWQPTSVSVGWAPYRHGRWRWVEPWGWTWIDEAPWGFAPFHYGRWACLPSGWVWVPGHYVRRPVYAPALVVFVGGNRWGLSVGFGIHNALAWFPLGHGELWMPHYRASRGYIRNLNVTNVVINNYTFNDYHVSQGRYVNRAVPGAMTAVPRDAFVGGHAVSRAAFRVQPRDAAGSDVVSASAPVPPRADSFLGARTGRGTRPTTSAFERTVVARATPPRAPVPYQARARALEANGGRPLDTETLANLRREARPTERTAGLAVRIAGARDRFGGERPGSSRRASAEAGEEPEGRVTPTPGSPAAGMPVPRAQGERGERLRTDDEPATQAASPAERSSGYSSDRPSWAGERGTQAVPTNPRYNGGDRAVTRPLGRSDEDRPAESRGRQESGADRPRWGQFGGATERPGSARPEPGRGDRPVPGTTPPAAGSDRPADRGSAGIETGRPRWGERNQGDGGRPSGPPSAGPGRSETSGDSGSRAVERPGGGNRPSAPAASSPSTPPPPPPTAAPPPSRPSGGVAIPGARPSGGRGGAGR